MKVSKVKRFILNSLVLFMLGSTLCVASYVFQRNKINNIFNTNSKLLRIIPSSLWIPFSCGLIAVISGLLYPCVDYKLGQMNVYEREWSSVIRCVALFVGINHATAKLDFTSESQLSFSLAAMSIGLWWFFDRSGSGMLLAICIASLATISCSLFNYIGYYSFPDPNMVSWLPCILFSGGVTFGLVGRQLAKPDVLEYLKEKSD